MSGVLFALFFLIALPAHATALIDINTADAALLDSLPGIGPVRAAAIITYRSEHGHFARIDDLLFVKGIGPVTLETMRALITAGTSSLPKEKPVLKLAPPAPTLPLVQHEKTVTSSKGQSIYELAAVTAPTGSAEAAPVGAVVPREICLLEGITSSPWTLGFVGLVVFTGAVLLLL